MIYFCCIFSQAQISKMIWQFTFYISFSRYCIFLRQSYQKISFRRTHHRNDLVFDFLVSHHTHLPCEVNNHSQSDHVQIHISTHHNFFHTDPHNNPLWIVFVFLRSWLLINSKKIIFFIVSLIPIFCFFKYHIFY